MNLTESIAPKSDQWNADDLIVGPVTVTIESVTEGTNEQPANVHLVETPKRAYRPSKSMRRVMVVAWGKESDAYAGHRLVLFRNPEIKFGGVKVGGIEIAAMSHIDEPLTFALTRSRGKREPFTVDPLATTDRQGDVAVDDVGAEEVGDPRTPSGVTQPETGEAMTAKTRAQMFALLTERGFTERDARLSGMSAVIGRTITSPSELTEAEGVAVIASLRGPK